MTTFNEHALELSIMKLLVTHTQVEREEIHKEVSDVLLLKGKMGF